jgi:hypothetical protein
MNHIERFIFEIVIIYTIYVVIVTILFQKLFDKVTAKKVQVQQQSSSGNADQSQGGSSTDGTS